VVSRKWSAITEVYQVLHGSYKKYLLLGGFRHGFYFPFHIWDVILPIDSYFFKMVIAPPTSLYANQVCFVYISIYIHIIYPYIYIGHSMHPSSWSSPLASTFEASAFQGDHLNDQNVVVVSIDKSSLHWSLLNIQCVKIIHTKSYYINPHINQELIKPSPNESRVAPSNCR